MITLKIPSVRVYVARFADYLDGHCAWGSLHVVLDDGNLEDSHVRFCLDWAREEGDAEGADLAALLLQMSRTQRGKIGRLACEESARRDRVFEEQE
jgi:hypothetical protein